MQAYFCFCVPQTHPPKDQLAQGGWRHRPLGASCLCSRLCKQQAAAQMLSQLSVHCGAHMAHEPLLMQGTRPKNTQESQSSKALHTTLQHNTSCTCRCSCNCGQNSNERASLPDRRGTRGKGQLPCINQCASMPLPPSVSLPNYFPAERSRARPATARCFAALGALLPLSGCSLDSAASCASLTADGASA